MVKSVKISKNVPDINEFFFPLNKLNRFEMTYEIETYVNTSFSLIISNIIANSTRNLFEV